MGLLGLLLFGIYGGGAWKFWQGFDRTTYSDSRVFLTALWPLLLTNRAYRNNFKKTLK